MTDDDNFEFITSKRMGRMHHVRYRKLRANEERQVALMRELEELSAAQDEMVAAELQRRQIDTSGPFRGMRVDDRGYVTAHYCPCTTCQATLNNMTVVAATEAMIRRGLVHTEAAAALLRNAAELDKQRGPRYSH